jgi:hypothetical protein
MEDGIPMPRYNRISTREGMENPLERTYVGDRGDASLVHRARAGGKAALDSPIERHQRWICNIVLRMVGGPEDAEDASQEILLKIVTKLSTFKGKSSSAPGHIAVPSIMS